MAGFLPPISTTTGLGNRLLNVLKIELKPISNEPVKSRPSIALVLLQLRADRAARAGDHVEDAARQAGQVRDLGQLDAAQRGIARGLVDDRVAGHERAARGPAGECHREVEGADHGPDAVRLEHRPGVDGRIAEVAHGVVEAVVGLDLVAVVADQVGRLLDVAERLEPVLADLDRHQGRELHLALADQVRHAAHDRDALEPRRPGPARGGGAGGGDGVADVRAGAFREVADERAVDRRALLEGFPGRAPLPVDVDAVGAAELAYGRSGRPAS